MFTPRQQTMHRPSLAPDPCVCTSVRILRALADPTSPPGSCNKQRHAPPFLQQLQYKATAVTQKLTRSVK